MEPYDRYVFGIGFTLISLIFGVKLGLRWRRGKASVRWPTTTAEILHSIAKLHGEGFRAKVKYRYHVNGREYRGSRVSFSLVKMSEDAVDVARFLPAARVPVYYDPQSPRISTLETGAGTRAGWIVGAVGTVTCFVLGIAVLCCGSFAAMRYFSAACLPCISLIAAYFVWLGWTRGKASLNWPAATGEILLAKVRENDASFSPQVKYRYSIDGKEYQGNTISYRGHYTDRETAAACIARFPVGAQVSVYYDPESPTVSTLEVGNGPVKHLLIAIVVLAVIFCAGIAIWIWGDLVGVAAGKS